MAEVVFSIGSQKAKLQFELLHSAEGSWEGPDICKIKLQRNGFRRSTWPIKLCKQSF